MKKTVLLVLGLVGTVMAHADDYTYLTFLDSNGTEQSVTATELVITFSNGQLIATDNSGKVTTIALSELNKMYFSNRTTAIDGTEAEDSMKSQEVEVYTLEGTPIGNFENIQQARTTLQKGIYVAKTASQAIKVAIQ